MKTLLSFLWLLVALNGYGQSIEPARLILYREQEFIFNKKAYTFKLNDKQGGKLSPDHFLELVLAPGRIKIEFVNDYLVSSRPFWITIQPGQTYYIKVAIDVDFIRTTALIGTIPEEQAKRELRRMKPQPAAPSE